MKNISIKDFLYTSIDSAFMLNDKWLCKCYTMFSDWIKDVNSPSMNSQGKIKLKYTGDIYDGLMIVQFDPNLADEYYASVFIRKEKCDNWETMFNVTNIKHCPKIMF